MELFPTQYGELAIAVTPFDNVAEHTEPDVQFGELNDEIQRTNEDRKARIKSIKEDQLDVDAHVVFSTEPYHFAVNAADLPERFRQSEIHSALKRLGKRKMIIDGGTRHTSHTELLDEDGEEERRYSPVIVFLHILKDPQDFAIAFAHYNRDRTALPKNYRDFIDAQTFMRKLLAGEIYYKGINAFLAQKVALNSPVLNGRVKGPGLKPTEDDFISYADLCGAFQQAQVASDFRMFAQRKGRARKGEGSTKDSNKLIVPLSNHLPIMQTTWDAMTEAVASKVFTDERFAWWTKRALGTLIMVFFAGALAIAKEVTQDGQMADQKTLRDLRTAIADKCAQTFVDELSSNEAKNGYAGKGIKEERKNLGVEFRRKLLAAYNG